MEGVTRKRRNSYSSLTDNGEGFDSPRKVCKRNDDNYLEMKNFLRLYDDAVDGLMRLGHLEDDQIELAIKTITTSFHYREGRQFSDVDLEDPRTVCGYLHRFATLHTALVREKVLEAFTRCSEFRSILDLPVVNVVSLGGGPGSDFVGMCSALQQLRHRLFCFKLNFLVVDSVRRWSSCLNQIELLLREDKGTDYGGASELLRSVEVNPSFLRVELPGLTEDVAYFDALQRADILIMVKVLSVLKWDEMRRITESVIQSMKPGSLLLQIDSPSYEEIFSGLKTLHKSELGDKFILNVCQERFGYYSAQECKAQLCVMQKEPKN